jgi:hypothetical protein
MQFGAFEQQFGASPAVVCAGTLIALTTGVFVYSLMFDDHNSTEEEQPNIGCRTMFKPTLEWQEVLSYHVCPAGLEFRMDMGSGKNFARVGRKAKTGDVEIPGKFLSSAIDDGLVETQLSLSDVPLSAVLKKMSEIDCVIANIRASAEKAAALPDGIETRKEHRRIAAAMDRLQRDEIDAISTGALPAEEQAGVKARRKELNRTIEGIREKVLARV